MRSAPEVTASTTSFTVHPTLFLMAFTSSSGMCENATLRCDVIVVLNDVRGALNSEGGGSKSGVRLRRRMFSATSAVRRIAFSAANGWRARELRA